MWLDSHCHLSADDFDPDREEVLARARAAGVTRLLAIGSGYGTRRLAEAADLASRIPDLWATAGIHPHEARELDDGVRRRLRQALARPEVLAVGECGLDYYYENSPRDTQREAFAEQVALARELDLPVTLHVRDRGTAAYQELLDIWRSEGGGTLVGVVHCFTGSADFARRALDLGLHLSFSGILTFARAEALREVAASLPLDRLLVETDAPFLAPEGHRGRRNEPAWVACVGERLAELHRLPAEELAERTSQTARALFRIPD